MQYTNEGRLKTHNWNIYNREGVITELCSDRKKIIESKFYTFVENDDGGYDIIKWVN